MASGYPLPPMDAKAQLFLVFSVSAIMLTMGLGLTADDFRRIARSERWAKRIEGPVKGTAALLLLLIILGSLRGNGDKLAAAALSSGAAVVALNVSGMLVGWGLARAAGLPLPQQLTIALEVGIQNATLAFALGLVLLRGDLALLPPIFLYSLLVYFTGALLVVAGRRAHARTVLAETLLAEASSPLIETAT